MEKILHKWERLETKKLLQARVFDLMVSKVKHPISGYIDDYYTIRANDWVNVIPITPSGEIVMVKQYRHGIEEFSLELPGGMLDDHENDPIEAAKRELLEETGYDSSDISYLGKISPNPAVQNNYCHFFVAKEARLVSEQKLDAGEDIEVLVVPFAKIIEMLIHGEIVHALMICAFLKFLLTKVDTSALGAMNL
ncbi:MAG: NUDIX hydrolase [Deltaproteobacteria bacterium]|nr:NUDIX hydrolase [Deltaproteobacteria bacterium]